MNPFRISFGLCYLALLISAGAQTPYPGGRWSPPPAAFGTTFPDSLNISLPDGTLLKAQVYYPAEKSTQQRASGSFPVIIEMTPYPSLRAPVSPIEFLTQRGYIYAVVRPRGSGGSTGALQQFSSIDGMDGAFAAKWASKLPGSDGRVGFYGCSYPGGTALAAAAFAGPESPIKASVCACIGLDMQHRQVWTTNGLPNGALTAYAPMAEFIMGGVPSATEYFAHFYQHLMAGGPEAYNGYWDHRLPLDWAGNIVNNDIPTLIWSGWKDINETGAINAIVAMQNAAAGLPLEGPLRAGTPTDPRFQLIMGDWGHAGGLDPGIVLQWFETWLKGVDTGIETTAKPLHLFENGSKHWINADHSPLVNRYTTYQLSGQGTLVSGKTREGTATLRFVAPDEEGGKLAFTSLPFAEGATLAGPVSIRVQASSTTPNMAILASLYDVAPDGSFERISFGAILASQRALDPDRSWTDRNGTMIRPWPLLRRDEFLVPGQVYELHIPLPARQWAILPGHQLRLELSSRSGKDICPDEGRVAFASEPCRLTAPQLETLPGGVYTVYMGGKTGSAIHLPLLPYHTFEPVLSGPPPADWTSDKNVPYFNFTLPRDWGKQ